MIYQLVIAVAGIGLLMAAWFLVQGWVRRHSPEVPEDGDVLEGRWGCYGCLFAGRCRRTCESSEDAQSLTP